MRALPRILLSLTVLLLPALVAAYTVQPVKWPGTVKGTIRLTGEFTPGAPMPLDRDVAACGKEIPDDSILINSDKRLQHAVVFLDGVEAGKELPRRQVQADIRNCRLPRVLSLSLGDELSLGSVDSVLHQVRTELQSVDGKPLRPPMNSALPPSSGRLKVKPTAPGWVRVKGVHAHPWMAATVRVFDHPYHAVTGSEGTFELRDVPPGKFTVRVWHERLGELSKNIEVRSGYVERVELEYGAQAAPAQ